MKSPSELEPPVTADERRKIEAAKAEVERHFSNSKAHDDVYTLVASDERPIVRDTLAKEIRDAGWIVRVRGPQVIVERPDA